MKMNYKDRENEILIILRSLWKVSSLRKRIDFLSIIFLGLLCGFFEILTLSSLLPLLEQFTSSKSENISYGFLLKFLNNYLGIFDLKLLFLIFSFLIFCSAIIRLITIRYSYNFAAKLGNELSLKAFTKIIYCENNQGC